MGNEPQLPLPLLPPKFYHYSIVSPWVSIKTLWASVTPASHFPLWLGCCAKFQVAEPIHCRIIAILLLINYAVTLTFDLWPLTFAMYRLWSDEIKLWQKYKIWLCSFTAHRVSWVPIHYKVREISNKPRRVIDALARFRRAILEGRAQLIDWFRGCVDTSSLKLRTEDDNRSITLLFQRSDTLLHQQTRAAES